MRLSFYIILFLLSFICSIKAQLLIKEDFSDGAFNNFGAGINGSNWSKYGNGCNFRPTNNRSVPTALSNVISLNPTSGGWDDGAQWCNWDDKNHDGKWQDNELNYFLVHKYNDIPVLKYTVFSDFLNKNNFASIEVAFLEFRASLVGDPHYLHDQSWESMVSFYRTPQASCSAPHQLETNVENTENCNGYISNYAHKNGWFNESDLDQTFASTVLWRNEEKRKKVNIEQWGNAQKGEYEIDTIMTALLDPHNEYSKFSYVQITFFRGQAEQTSQRFRAGCNYSNAQLGITNLEIGIIKRADFNMSYKVDAQDADSIIKYKGMNSGALLTNGDATNDGKVNLLDANQVIAYWDTIPSVDVSASGVYNPTTGEIKVSLNNINYFHLEGGTGNLNGTTPVYSTLNAVMTEDNDDYSGTFTKANWMGVTNHSLGNIAKPGLNPNDLYIVANYKGSMNPFGFRMPLNGTVFTSIETPTTSGATVEVYPNPTKDVLHIRNIDSNVQLDFSIYNITGELVMSKSNFPDRTINIKTLNKGIFVLNLKINEQVIIKKIVKL